MTNKNTFNHENDSERDVNTNEEMNETEAPETAEELPVVDGEKPADTEDVKSDDADTNDADTSKPELTLVVNNPSNSKKSNPSRRRHHWGRQVACGVGLAAVLAVSAARVSWADSECSRYAALDASIDQQITETIDSHSDYANLTADDLAADDSDLIAQYIAAVNAASAQTSADVPEGPSWYDVTGASGTVENARAAYEQRSDALDTLNDVTSQIETSLANKESEDAQAALNQAISDAQTLLDDTEGKVDDNSVRDTLSSSIESAQAVADVTHSDPSTYEDAQSSLETAVEAVKTANSEWQAEQNRIAAASSSTSSSSSSSSTKAASTGSSSSSTTSTSSSSSSTSTSSDTWVVSYRATDNDSRANDDGSVSEWRDGYFIAHNWSYGGKMIASKPSHVVVDGVSYHYVSSQVVSRQGTDVSAALSYARANGGIGFQTCIGDGTYVLITHYEKD